MPHLSGVPVRSRALIARRESLNKRQDNTVLAGRFGKVKNTKALSKVATVTQNTKKKVVFSKGLVRSKNRRVPRPTQGGGIDLFSLRPAIVAPKRRF